MNIGKVNMAQTEETKLLQNYENQEESMYE